MPSPSQLDQLNPVTSSKAMWQDLIPTSIAAVIAVFVSYAGPFLIILQAAHVAQLSHAQINSWVWAISVGAGVCGLVLSWRYRLPVICAWNSPGAALLVGALAHYSYAQAIGAYMLAALLVFLIGLSGMFGKLINSIPRSLCAALLAGILFRFASDVFVQAGGTEYAAAALVAAMFVSYLLAKRYSPRYAICLSLLCGVVLSYGLGWGQAGDQQTSLVWQGGFTLPQWQAPEFTVSALLSLGLPLALLCLTGQQVPGIAVLQSSGYATPTNQLVSSTGLASLLGAGFGGHGVNLAAITAAICTGAEAHHEAGKRWLAGVVCGALYIIVGCFAATLTAVLLQLPHVLVISIAGLALLGAIQNGLVQALAEPAEREAALITFVVTVTNQSLFGLGAACWAILAGLLAYYILRPTQALKG